MKRFGIDRLADRVTRHIRGTWVAVAAVTVLAAIALASGLSFNGDVSAVLKKDTPDYRLLQRVEQAFHPFSSDEVLVVEADGGLDAPDAYAALETFVLDLQLVEDVEAVLSVFSLPDRGDADPYLGSDAALRLGETERLTALRERQPLSRELLSADLTATIVLLMVAQPRDGDPVVSLGQAARAEILTLARDHAGAIRVTPAGIGAIHRSIEEALRKDQKLLASVSTVLCVLLSLLIFRSWRGALICALPPITGVVWFFGFAAATGITIDPVTTIIPTLLLVVGFADTVHLYFAYLRHSEAGAGDALRVTIAGTGPACFLTSLTTAIACLGVGAAGSATLNVFAVSGFAGMLIQFAAVISLFPLLVRLLAGGSAGHTSKRMLRFSAVAAAAGALVRRQGLVIGAAIVLLAALLVVQTQLETGFRLSEHLDDDSTLRQTELRLRDKGLETGQILAVIADADGVEGFGPQDRRRMSAVMAAVADGDDAAPFVLAMPAADAMSRESHPLLKRFIARDGLSYLVPVPIDLSLTSTEIAAEADRIASRLRAEGLDGAFELTGLALLSVTEVPRMIGDLRIGFYVALVLVVGVLIYATGSVRLGLLSLLPNLIPILGVEAWLFASGQQLSMTAAVALTIAFGIVVDDSIHYLNCYQRARGAGDGSAAVTAIAAVTPPIAASTALLVAGLSVTLASSLPTVTVFGQLVSAALVLALVASLFILPSFINRFAEASQ